MTTALTLFEQIHGKDCEFLSKHAVIDIMEIFARSFYAQKLQQTIIVPNDSYSEKRKKYPDPPTIGDLP